MEIRHPIPVTDSDLSTTEFQSQTQSDTPEDVVVIFLNTHSLSLPPFTIQKTKKLVSLPAMDTEELLMDLQEEARRTTSCVPSERNVEMNLSFFF